MKNSKPTEKDKSSEGVNESLGVMVYAHLKITDSKTGEILVNKRG